jgi:hypothetical protein
VALSDGVLPVDVAPVFLTSPVDAKAAVFDRT